MEPLVARRTLATVRLAIGTGSILAPRVTMKIFGMEPDDNPAMPFMARLFGARELALAAPFLMPTPGLDEEELATRGVPVDALDAVSAVAAGIGGYLPWRAVVPAAGIAAFAAYLGSVGSQSA